MREELIAYIKAAQRSVYPITSFKLTDLDHYQSKAIFFGSRIDSHKVRYVEASGNEPELLSVEDAVDKLLEVPNATS